MTELLDWLDESSFVPEVVTPPEKLSPVVPPAPPATPPTTSAAPEPDDEPPLRPVRPIPAIGSRAYQRAPLGKKFWIATTVRVESALGAQRELQNMMLSPAFDPWKGSLVLMRIEAAAAVAT